MAKKWGPHRLAKIIQRLALSRQQILDYVWSDERDVLPSLVDVYVSYLRGKLGASGEPDPIKTVRGVGYRFKE